MVETKYCEQQFWRLEVEKQTFVGLISTEAFSGLRMAASLLSSGLAFSPCMCVSSGPLCPSSEALAPYLMTHTFDLIIPHNLLQGPISKYNKLLRHTWASFVLRDPLPALSQQNTKD